MLKINEVLWPSSPLVITWLLVLFLLPHRPVRADNGLSRGFGDNIEWKPFRTALQEAERLGKPIFLLLHKSRCGACRRLKGEMSSSKELAELSDQFLMVNAEDDEDPHRNPIYNIDGGYVPRLFFLGPDGHPTPVFNEAGQASYKYFYYTAEQILASMKRALSVMGSSNPPTADKDL